MLLLACVQSLKNRGPCPIVQITAINISTAYTFRPIYAVLKECSDEEDLFFYPSNSEVNYYGFYWTNNYFHKKMYGTPEACDFYPALQFNNTGIVGPITILDGNSVSQDSKCQTDKFNNAIIMHPRDTKLILIWGCLQLTPGSNGLEEHMQTAWVGLHSHEYDTVFAIISAEMFEDRVKELVEFSGIKHLKENLQLIKPIPFHTEFKDVCPKNPCKNTTLEMHIQGRAFYMYVIWFIMALIVQIVFVILCK